MNPSFPLNFTGERSSGYGPRVRSREAGDERNYVGRFHSFYQVKQRQTEIRSPKEELLLKDDDKEYVLKERKTF